MNRIDNIPFYYEIPDKKEVFQFYKAGIHTYIFVNQNEFAQTDKLDFLHKIMAATKLTPHENAMIVPVDTDSILQFSGLPTSEICKCVFFGIEAKNMEFQGQTNLYERIQTLHLQFLFAHRLAEYGSETNKKLLWNALKEMFL